jgi:hypothetical protein
MYTLKKLSRKAIPAALQKAERYRLLNDPFEAESICLDILEADPNQQEALIMLLLARTDLFGMAIEPAFSKAREVLSHLNDRHCRAYYGGIIYERRAKAHLARGGPGSGRVAHGWFVKAMDAYEQAMTTCAPGNQDALLRWNTCARILNENPDVEKGDETSEVQMTDSWD